MRPALLRRAAGLPARRSSESTDGSTCGFTAPDGWARADASCTTSPTAGHWLGYQQAVVTADGTPTRPSIHGLYHPRTFGVRTLEDAVSLCGLLDAGPIGRALVVGTDHLGLEMAAALVPPGRSCRAGRADR